MKLVTIDLDKLIYTNMIGTKLGWVNEVNISNAIVKKMQEPKTGHWINAKVGKLFPSNDFKCSECGNLLDFDGVNCGRGDANFCPNCGAKMESEEDHD